MAEKLQTISDIRRHISGMLKKMWPDKEAEALTTAIIKEYTAMSGAAQLAFGDRLPEEKTAELILSAAQRSAEGEPLQYIFGYTEFCGHNIEVEPGVLIPRPETEEMVMMIIKENAGFRGTVTDLCTGSGCIAIALSLAFPDAVTVATDNSQAALRAAANNIVLTGAHVTLYDEDIFSDELSSVPESDILVSNPPYVRLSEKKAMHINILNHEPYEALFVPDDDPLLYYRQINTIASRRLSPGGVLWLEINENLAKETALLLEKDLYSNIQIIKDIRGKDRFIKADRNG